MVKTSLPEELDAARSQFQDDEGLHLNELGWLLDHHKAKEQERRQMIDDFGLRPGQKVLDLGCGPGLWTELLAEKISPGGRVVGVDGSGALLDYATTNLAHSPNKDIISFVKADFCSLPFADDSFDFVFFGNCFMYVNNPAVVLDEQKRVLKAGGRAAAKDFDGAVLVLHPAEPELCLKVATAAAHAIHLNAPEPYFDNFFGRKLNGLFNAAGFTDVATTSYAIQKTYPLTAATKRYITNNATWYSTTGLEFLTDEDLKTWESYFDDSSVDYILDSKEFYYCMLEVISVGTLFK